MATPLVTPDLTWLWKAEDSIGDVAGVGGSASNITVGLETLDCSGEAWLDGITQGLTIQADYAATTGENAYFRIPKESIPGYIPGANNTYAWVFENPSVDDDRLGMEQYYFIVNTLTSLNFSGEYKHINILNGYKKSALTFAAYQANSANMSSPVHWDDATTEEDPYDWDSAPEHNVWFYMHSSTSAPAAIGQKVRIIGCVRLADPTPQVVLTVDDGYNSIYSVLFLHAKSQDVPFHCFLNADVMPGGVNHNPANHLTIAQLDEMRDYIRPNGQRLVTFGNHSATHETLQGRRSTDITFPGTNEIASASGSLAFLRTGTDYIIRAPGDANDGVSVTFSAVSDTSCTTNETITNTGATARTDGVFNWIDRIDADREAQILGGEAFLAPYWAGQWKTFAEPFGYQCSHTKTVLEANNYKLCRETEGTYRGNQFGSFLNHTGYPDRPMRLQILCALGNEVNTLAEVAKRMDVAERVGGLVVINSHTFTDGVSAQDFDSTLVLSLLTDWRARDDAGTIKLRSMNEVTEAMYGPAAGGGGPSTRRRRR